jgi:surface protein
MRFDNVTFLSALECYIENQKLAKSLFGSIETWTIHSATTNAIFILYGVLCKNHVSTEMTTNLIQSLSFIKNYEFNNESLKCAVYYYYCEDKRYNRTSYYWNTRMYWEIYSNTSWMLNQALFRRICGHISEWNVSNVTDMSNLFSHNMALVDEDLGQWNVSRVKNMNCLFQGAENFCADLSKWDVGSVTNMGNMFDGAIAFNCLIGIWNIRSLCNARYMFYDTRIEKEYGYPIDERRVVFYSLYVSDSYRQEWFRMCYHFDITFSYERLTIAQYI